MFGRSFARWLHEIYHLSPHITGDKSHRIRVQDSQEISARTQEETYKYLGFDQTQRLEKTRIKAQLIDKFRSRTKKILRT